MVRRNSSIGFLGVFGRSEDLRSLDRALRAADLHPAQVPDAAKLTALNLLKDARGESPSDRDYAEAAALIAYCALGPEGFARANGETAAARAEARIEMALEAGVGLDANLILLTLHAALIHPAVKQAFQLESE
jgi:hypothetical protein